MSGFLPALPAALPDSPAWPALIASIDELLRGTLATRQAQAHGEDTSKHIAALRHSHEALERLPTPAPCPGQPIAESDARRAFAAGALRLKYYRQTVLSRRPLIDTAGSLTLSEYEPDLHTRSQQDADAWRADIAKVCQLSDTELDAIEASILPDEIHAVALRKRIMDALVVLLKLREHPRRAAKALLDRVFPGHPMREDECDIICTAASIYLCLPYEDGRWTTRGPEQHSDPALMAFLRRIARPLQTTMAHFPAFAPIDPAQVDHGFLCQLSRQSGQTVDDIRERLCTMITILPTPRIDQFIIHDVWGHQWQAHLFQFEEAYVRVAAMTRKPPLSATALAVAELYAKGQHEQARQDWLQHLNQMLSDNLLDSLSGLIAEIFADAIEHKFLVLHPERRDQLLSSSYFKELPTKLDLTLADLPLYFRMATRGVARLGNPAHLAPFRAALAEALPAWPAEQIQNFSESVALWTNEVLDGPQWQRELRFTEASEGSTGNAFVLVAAELTRFQLAFNRLHQRLQQHAGPSAHALLPRFQDLLIFTTASFFELNRERNLWRLTEFVEDHFEPMYKLLMQTRAAS